MRPSGCALDGSYELIYNGRTRIQVDRLSCKYYDGMVIVLHKELFYDC